MFYYVANRRFYLSIFLLKMIFLSYLRVVVYILRGVCFVNCCLKD